MDSIEKKKQKTKKLKQHFHCNMKNYAATQVSRKLIKHA